MTLHRLVLVALCALATVPAGASASTPSRAAFELSPAGKRTLAAASLVVGSVPKGPRTQPSFAIGAWSVSSSARIALTGSWRFSAGKRRVSISRLQVTIGRTSSYVTGRIGKGTLRLFTLTPTRPSLIDAQAKRASMVGARFALTTAAANRLRSALKLKRTPSTGALGKLTVAVADLAMTVPPTSAPPMAFPAPAPEPTATATPTPTPTPGPELPCEQRFAATPAGSLDWFGCDLAGSGDLKSWTNYVQSPFPQVPCQGPVGTVAAGGGASRIVAGTAFDHRFTISSAEFRPDGSATIVAQGTITYTMPVHGIEESIGAFRLEIAVGGLSGTVYADGRAKPRDMGGNVCATPAAPYAAQPVLTLDLTHVTPISTGGVKRWVHVPARIAPGHALIGGGTYAAGSNWGAFTIAVPEP